MCLWEPVYASCFCLLRNIATPLTTTSHGDNPHMLLYVIAALHAACSSPFGMTDTLCGGKHARSTVFSLLVCDTQITWCTSASTHLSSLLVMILLASAKPNREWSVKTTYRNRTTRCQEDLTTNNTSVLRCCYVTVIISMVKWQSLRSTRTSTVYTYKEQTSAVHKHHASGVYNCMRAIGRIHMSSCCSTAAGPDSSISVSTCSLAYLIPHGPSMQQSFTTKG